MRIKIRNMLLIVTLLAGLHRTAARAGDGTNCAPPETVYIGNSLTVTNGGPDGVPPLVILGEYSPAGPLATSPIMFPDAGEVTQVEFYGGNYDFTLYALAYVGGGSNADEQTFKVDAAASFTLASAPDPGIVTLAVSNFVVNAGDFLAFAGIGPYYPQNPNDGLHSDATYENASQAVGYDNDTATPPGGPGSEFIVGLNRDTNATYGYIADNFGNQGRTYAIGVEFQPTPRHCHHPEPPPSHFHHHDDRGDHGDKGDKGDHGDHGHGN
jgi:hypothetical protein